MEFDAGRGHSACWRTSARTKNLRLLYGHGQQDIKVEAAKARRVALARAPFSSRRTASGLSKGHHSYAFVSQTALTTS